MDEGRNRVIGVMAAVLASPHIRNADDLFSAAVLVLAFMPVELLLQIRLGVLDA
jgi:hypothetical protein